MLEVNDFNAIRISLASPEQIHQWSYGEVTKPETINYRTLRPEKDGLFCERIFGPTRDWECYCGKYKRVRYKGITCEKCGVEVTRSKVRRERMGHIDLASPVSHIWYFKGTPSRLSLLMDLSPRNLEKILYFAQYVVYEVHDVERRRLLADLQRQEKEMSDRLSVDLAKEIDRVKNPQAQSAADRAEEDRLLSARIVADSEAEEEAIWENGTSLEAELKEMLGEIADEDIFFGDSTELIVAAGDTINQKHIAHVKLAAARLIDEVKAQRDREQGKRALDVAISTTPEALSGSQREQIDSLRRDSDRQLKEGREKLQRRRDILEKIKVMALPTEQEVREWNDQLPGLFKAGMGAEAVRTIISRIDLDKLALELREEIRSQAAASQRRKKATKRLRVVEAFRKNGPEPEWMILTVLPVIPPDLRPMVQLDGGRFATSDLNDLYRRVINRNNRLKRLLELNAPEIIVRNEKRMLQEACDALIDNGRRGRAVSGSGNHKLKSLSDMLKGKQGRFRQNLLGKRVDYSGRSVIVVGPDLKLHQCGLPKKMALELFKPFVMRKLVERGLAHNIRSAKRMIERLRPEVWDVLEEVIRNHPVLLNRAPTLHRLGIQAFEAVLVEGSAIKIHPLVCTAFNADFDGDQMAVHIPLSLAAQMEARMLMLSSRNLLSPADGEPMVQATKDMVLGCYYLTMDLPGEQGEGKLYGDFLDVINDYEHRRVGLHVPIYLNISRRALQDAGEWIDTPVGQVRRSDLVAVPGSSGTQALKTTPGRIIFNEILPRALSYKNYVMKKGELRDVIGECYRELGPETTAQLADDIKRIGFHYATQSGTTMAISDVTIPPQKHAIIADTQKEVDKLEREYRRGLITSEEQSQAQIKLWTEANKKVGDAVKGALDPYGSIYVMATSGAAKGQFTQIGQLAGMRGLMADPSGKTIPLPIKSNFREGLTVLEYFISTHGARKGLADTALRTAESGYLTRRLIDVAQDVIVYNEDCGSDQGIWLEDPLDAKPGPLTQPFKNRIVGRFAASSYADPRTGEILVGAHEEITERGAGRIVEAMTHADSASQRRIQVRSVLTCQSKRGICQKCYGWSMATRAMVILGEAVGIIAAESIGEPGTQLTMRTFHTGGIAGSDITQGLPRVEELFEAREPKDKAVISQIDGRVEISQEKEALRIRVIASQIVSDKYTVPEGYALMTNDGAAVAAGDELAKLIDGAELNGERMVARKAGTVFLNNNELVIRYEDTDVREYVVPPTTRLKVEHGQMVRAGDDLTEGSIDPDDLLNILGPEAVQRYLVDEVQRVYRSQGVTINDKHLEVIVRQMLRKVEVDSAGDTELLPRELVDRFAFQDINARVLAQDGEPATARTVLLGITKASLNTESFLAAASFQETTRVLTEAAISGKKDRLMGLKENVIIGKLIPAGTGLAMRRRRQEAAAVAAGQAPALAGVLRTEEMRARTGGVFEAIADLDQQLRLSFAQAQHDGTPRPLIDDALIESAPIANTDIADVGGDDNSIDALFTGGGNTKDDNVD